MLGIQPIVATLVLMVAGRGLAQVITNEKILYPDNSPAYKLIGGGYLLAVPFSILIAGAIFALTAVLTRRTALGSADRGGRHQPGGEPAGRRRTPGRSSGLVYIFCGFCAGLAGLMLTSNSTSADPNSIGLFIELDAILAVVIGGTSLAGGRFSLAGTLIGAFIIETMDNFVDHRDHSAQHRRIQGLRGRVVCILQSPKATRADGRRARSAKSGRRCPRPAPHRLQPHPGLTRGTGRAHRCHRHSMPRSPPRSPWPVRRT